MGRHDEARADIVVGDTNTKDPIHYMYDLSILYEGSLGTPTSH